MRRTSCTREHGPDRCLPATAMQRGLKLRRPAGAQTVVPAQGSSNSPAAHRPALGIAPPAPPTGRSPELRSRPGPNAVKRPTAGKRTHARTHASRRTTDKRQQVWALQSRQRAAYRSGPPGVPVTRRRIRQTRTPGRVSCRGCKRSRRFIHAITQSQPLRAPPTPCPTSKIKSRCGDVSVPRVRKNHSSCYRAQLFGRSICLWVKLLIV